MAFASSDTYFREHHVRKLKYLHFKLKTIHNRKPVDCLGLNSHTACGNEDQEENGQFPLLEIL